MPTDNPADAPADTPADPSPDVTAQAILEAAALLLRQFLEPDEDIVVALLDAAGLALTEDDDWRVLLTRTLRPRDGDYALVFRGDAAERARRGYEALWASAPQIAPRREHAELRLIVATAAALAADPAVAQEFPGGYRGVVDQLAPERHWVAWEYLVPGDSCGLQYNGLVYLDGRFAWFPKPWQVLEEA